eukprot:jgi/Botrbrau1/10520/Bobra.7_1s0004.1
MHVGTRELPSFGIPYHHLRKAGIRRRHPRPITFGSHCSREPIPSNTETQTWAACSNRRTILLSGLLGHLFLSPLNSQAAIVDEEVAERVFNAAAPSIVSIFNFKNVNGEDIAEGTGSGIVWDTRGHIVTNYHCISRLARDTTGSQKTIVGLTSGEGLTLELASEIVGLDPDHDLAVLRVDASPGVLSPIKVGTSSGLKVGQSVYAVGNPYGLSKTLTAGLVSGLNRTLPSPGNTKILGIIQTDASINRGSSGGALLDSAGRLVGLSTATFTRIQSARSSGVNFALPVDLLHDVVPKLIVYGSASGKGVRVAPS